jgi:hypothetical protein
MDELTKLKRQNRMLKIALKKSIDILTVVGGFEGTIKLLEIPLEDN